MGFSSPMRGGLPDRGRGHGRGGMTNVPRGPSVMRRAEPSRAARVETVRGDREKERRKRDKAQGPEIKTTMTDYRIVGIEVKELGWSWGMVELKENGEEKNGEAESEVKEGSAEVEEKEVEVKSEPEEGGDIVERKAKTPDGGEQMTFTLS